MNNRETPTPSKVRTQSRDDRTMSNLTQASSTSTGTAGGSSFKMKQVPGDGSNLLDYLEGNLRVGIPGGQPVTPEQPGTPQYPVGSRQPAGSQYPVGSRQPAGTTQYPVGSRQPVGTQQPINQQPTNQQPTNQRPANGQQSGNNSGYEQQVLDLVNQERQKAGLNSLTMDSRLSKVAMDKAQDMYNNNYFDHQSPTYGSPFDMMNSNGITYNSAGENIAKGQTSPTEVMNQWMNSPGHRANILNSSYTKIGIAYYNNEWVQEFTG